MHQPDRLFLELRRRVLDSAVERDDLKIIDLRATGGGGDEQPSLPAWIEETEEERKRPAFDRWLH